MRRRSSGNTLDTLDALDTLESGLLQLSDETCVLLVGLFIETKDRQGEIMTRTVNNVTLLGNLGGDPDTRELPNGTKVSNIRVATHRTYRDRNGEQQRETEFTPVVAYDRLAETVEQYLTKGRLVYVEGRLHTDQWKDRETGEPRSRVEVVARDIVFLDRPRTLDDTTTSNEYEEVAL